MKRVAGVMLVMCVAACGPTTSSDDDDGGVSSNPDANGPHDAGTTDAAASSSSSGTRSSSAAPPSSAVPSSSAVTASSSAVPSSSVVTPSSSAVPSSSVVTPSSSAVPPSSAVTPSSSAVPSSSADTPSSGAWVMPERAVCTQNYETPRSVGNLENDALVETSGVVASPSVDGLLWLHNDSGDTARIFGVGTQGEDLGTLTLESALVDLEDIAAAPCPGAVGPCLWLADLGNNTLDRTDMAIHAVLEPPLENAQPFGTIPATVTWRFPVVYPEDVNADVEALVLTPDGHTAYAFEKVSGSDPRLFKATVPQADGAQWVWENLGTFNAPGVPFVDHGKDITAADLHPSGTRLAMRVYTGVYEYRFTGTQGVPGILAPMTAPGQVTLGPLNELQGEAVAYDHAGTGLFTVAEGRDQMPGQAVNFYACP